MKSNRKIYVVHIVCPCDCGGSTDMYFTHKPDYEDILVGLKDEEISEHVCTKDLREQILKDKYSVVEIYLFNNKPVKV
jgi:hypothetical protein